MKGIAEQHLDSPIFVWVGERKDVVKVFELLELHLTNSKLSESPLDSKWTACIVLRYEDIPEIASQVIHASTARVYTGDDRPRFLLQKQYEIHR